MKFISLKMWTTVLMIGSHLGSIFLLIILFCFDGFKASELSTAIAVLIPLFAAFTSTIVRDAVGEVNSKKPSRADHSRVLPVGFCFITIAFCTAFVAYLFVISLMKGLGKGLQDFEQFKLLLGLGEAAFGVYVGMLLPVLFPRGSVANEVADVKADVPTNAPTVTATSKGN